MSDGTEAIKSAKDRITNAVEELRAAIDAEGATNYVKLSPWLIIIRPDRDNPHTPDCEAVLAGRGRTVLPSDDLRGCHYGFGNSPCHAIGRLVEAYPELFNVRIERQ